CIRISLSAAWIRSLHLKDDPECYKFNVTITFDNSKHDGKIPVETQTDAKKCSKTNYKRDA
ncbi:Mucolipin-1, partial [Exaiptasia diaphana]